LQEVAARVQKVLFAVVAVETLTIEPGTAVDVGWQRPGSLRSRPHFEVLQVLPMHLSNKGMQNFSSSRARMELYLDSLIPFTKNA
jgi:hypothetical protein